MMLTGDARRWKKLERLRAKHRRDALVDERDSIRLEIRKALLLPRAMDRRLRIEPLKTRYYHVERALHEASALLNRIEHELAR